MTKFKIAAGVVVVISVIGLGLLIARTFLGLVISMISSLLHFIMLVPLIVMPILLVWLLLKRTRN